jgi:hypothetical protein
VLRVQEPPRVAFGEPEVERVRGEDERRHRQAGECAQPVSLVPCEQGKGRQQRERVRPRQQSESGHRSRGKEAPPLGEQEGRQRQQQVERLAVDRLEEERKRKKRQVEDCAAPSLGAEPLLRDAV